MLKKKMQHVELILQSAYVNLVTVLLRHQLQFTGKLFLS